MTKHAVVALAEWLAVTYGDRGITVSCLCPQFVATPMLDVFDAGGEMRAWVDGLAVTTEQVADAVVEGLLDGRFYILPHPDVAGYYASQGGRARALAGRDAQAAGEARLPAPSARLSCRPRRLLRDRHQVPGGPLGQLVAPGQRGEPGTVVGLDEVRQLVDQHRVQHP